MYLSATGRSGQVSMPSPRFGAHYSVLSAEDNSTIQNTLAQGFTVAAARRGDTVSFSKAPNPEKAMEIMKAHDEPFDILISDNRMPHENQGMGLLDSSQTLGAKKPKHAFMYSDDPDAFIQEAIQHGAEDGYSKNNIKPFALAKELLNRLYGEKQGRLSPKRAITSPELLSTMVSSSQDVSPSQEH